MFSIIAEIAIFAFFSYVLSIAASFGIIAWIEDHPDGLVNRLWNTGAIGQIIFFVTFGIALIINFK